MVFQCIRVLYLCRSNPIHLNLHSFTVAKNGQIGFYISNTRLDVLLFCKSKAYLHIAANRTMSQNLLFSCY